MKMFRTACIVLSIFPHTLAQASCQTLDELAWLLGNWEVQTPDGAQQERWQRASNATFEGIGTSLNPQGGITASESLRLVSMQRSVFYLAKVGQNPLPVAFAAVHCAPDRATFENADHDFPQRLTYQRKGNRLTVEVTDMNGEGFVYEFVEQ